MAPQFECPQRMTSRIPSATSAYSSDAVVPPYAEPAGGTMLPALRMMKRSPGSAWSIRFGTTRESEHAMNTACGVWFFARRSKSSLCRG